MRLNKFAFAALVVLFCAGTVLAQKQETAVKAVQPEVQTAEWAQSWWMPRHKEKLAEKQKMGRVDLLMIGDSITHGWEGGGKKVWDENYADKHALNIGFSGDRTENVLWRLQHGEIEGISPKLAVIMIGTNNTGHRQDPPAETAAGIKAIIGELAQRVPDTKVLLLGIFPRGEDKSDPLRQINDGINDIIKTYADDKQIFYLDISDKFLDDDGKLPKSIMPDLLHPNEEGYRIWAKAMNPMIDKLMKP